MGQKKIFLSFFIVLLIHTFGLDAQGLKFIGIEAEPVIDKRTSIKVFSGKSHQLNENLEISFDLCTYLDPDFGFIFRLKNLDNNGRTWNLSYYREGGQVEIRLNEEAHFTLMKIVMSNQEFNICEWSKFRMKIDMVHNVASLAIADKSVSIPVDLPRTINPIIEFGCSDHYIDVANIALRNLNIKDNNESFLFPFDECDGNIAHERDKKARCFIKNPDWLLKESMEWIKNFEITSPSIAGVSFHKGKNILYFFNKSEITSFNLASRTSSTTQYTSECPTTLFCGRSWISSDGKYLYCYEPFTYTRENNSPTISRLDLETMEWSGIGYEQLQQHMHHHSGMLNPNNGKYFIFGGFGKQMYNGNFYEMEDDGKWRQLDNIITGPDHIQPRFFQGMGFDQNAQNLYIFGGMGNECGEQVVGREYFRDLYRINTGTGECHRMWESKWDTENMVPVGNLVVDNDSFYTLCYPEYKSEALLHLYKVSIKDGIFTEYAKPFSIVSDHIKTNVLFDYDSKMQKFIVAVLEYEDQEKCRMSVYTLSSPPLPAAQIKSIENRRIRNILIIVLIILIVLAATIAIIALVWAHRKRKFRKQYSDSKNNLQKRIFTQQIRPGGIYLFGEFTVTDSKGRDISDLFTTQLREILYLIIKYADQGGVLASKLGKIMWPDKDDIKIKNSRGVAIQKLRKILQMMDGPVILHDEGKYYLDISKGGYCDYYDFISLLSEEKDDNTLLNILSRGRFLRETSEETFDNFKAKIEQLSMDFLQKKIEESFDEGKFNETIEICDMIYCIDENDEKALKFTVKTLKKMGKVDEARVHYAEFSSRWRKDNGEDYPIGWEKL